MNIIVTGDIHGKFSYLNTLINKFKHKLDLVICCGDFGYWPKYSDNHKKIKSQGVPILWCDGNHEDHWAIKQITNNEIAKDVFYMPRGSTYTLKDGRVIMFMGGADSIDKNNRTIGIDWFPDEIITQKDMQNLPDVKVDILISHTCPEELCSTMVPYDNRKVFEPSNKALSALWDIYKPSLWFFGHWHVYKEGMLDNTKWYTLGCTASETRWWMWMP